MHRVISMQASDGQGMPGLGEFWSRYADPRILKLVEGAIRMALDDRLVDEAADRNWEVAVRRRRYADLSKRALSAYNKAMASKVPKRSDAK